MEQTISSDLIRGHIDTIILHTLLDSDKHAQQISDCVEEKSGGQYKMIQATLYSSLKRLESLKFVKSYWNDSDNGRRKFFELTAEGKKTVEENLSSWSYSRAIIDKLMDCEPAPVYKTEYVEKVVEVPKIVEIPKVVEVVKEVEVIKEVSPTVPNSQVFPENQAKTVNEKPIQTDNKQEINFRNILNGLIKSTAIQKSTQVEELEPLNKEKTEPVQEKQKFNETLTTTDYNAHKSNNNGKIDFGDLTLKAVKEGYKIRISSKESIINAGKILSNKLNFYSALFTFFIALVEFAIISLAYPSVLGLNARTISFWIALLIFPVAMLGIYIKNPHKTISKRISADSILTSAIVVFNLLLVTMAINLLANLDFSDIFSLIMAVVIPSLLFLDILAYFVVRYFLCKSGIFLIKKK